MNKKVLIICSTIAAYFSLAPLAVAVPPGYDLFETDPSQTYMKFEGGFTIPAGFFDTNSSPFTGTVYFGGEQMGSFEGKNVGDADTVVRRPQGANLNPPFPASDTVPIEIVQLNLVSMEPITVQVGNTTQKWDVKANLSPTQQSQGTMTINKENDNGGTFSSHLLVVPLLTFTRLSDNKTKTIDVGELIKITPTISNDLILTSDNVRWSDGCSQPALAVPGINDSFCPSFANGEKFLTLEQALQAQHGIYVAQPRLEHFKCYTDRAQKKFKQRSVLLTDQFGAKKTKVLRPLELCNPVKKNNEALVNKRAHLNCYAIKDEAPKVDKKHVLVRNQFGPQELTTVKELSLCQPASKLLLTRNKRGGKQPTVTTTPDHFKCYKVKGKLKKRTVRLKDQFGNIKATVIKPVQLCAPTAKDTSTKIRHPVQHLVCYLIKEKSSAKLRRRGYLKSVRVEDQFGKLNLMALRPTKLCVPSKKLLL